MAEPIPFIPATDLTARIHRGDLSPMAVVDAVLARIYEHNEELHAYITVCEEYARERAQSLEDRLEAGDPVGPLCGVPVAIKDLYAFKEGVRHTFGAKPFSDHVATKDAPFVERLEDAGAIIVGKTNTPEFGHKGETDNLLNGIGAASTPFDLNRTAGGSSGGSAVAVAAGLATIAQGSDVAGSIRIPAAFNGVVGIKPTHGRVPQALRPDAFLPHTPFFDAGPIARTVEDMALALDVMSGAHPRDPLSLPDTGGSFRETSVRAIDDLTIAYTADFDSQPIDPAVRGVFHEAIDVLGRTGADLVEATPRFDREWGEIRRPLNVALQVMYAALADGIQAEYGIDLLAHRDELPEKVVTRIEQGRAHSALEYRQLDVVRTEVFDTIQNLFTEHDLLVTPTATVPPYNIEDGSPSEVDGVAIDPSGWFLTFPFNLTGHPAASVPAGLTDDGLPVGLQIVGERFADETVIAASAAYERLNPWRNAYQQFQ